MPAVRLAGFRGVEKSDSHQDGACFTSATSTTGVLALPQAGEGCGQLALEVVDGGVEVCRLGAELHLTATDVDRQARDVTLVRIADLVDGEGETQDHALGEVPQVLLEGLGQLLFGIPDHGRGQLKADGGEGGVQACLSS